MELGWNIVIPDHRRFGLSGKSFPTYGLKESIDLIKVTDWIFNTFNKQEQFGILGESMGAATALMYATREDRVNFVISDCSFSSLKELQKQALIKLKVSKLLFPIIHSATSFFMKFRAGFTLNDIDLIKVIPKISVPILLIHGKKDKQIPFEMAEEIFNSRLNSQKIEISLFDNADHAESILKYPDEYKKTVFEFINANKNK